MAIVDTENMLKDLGYSYVKIIDPPVEPKKSSIKFGDIAPELFRLGIGIANDYLYNHQLTALNLLREGYNVILKAGTGSGKTESWYFYFYEKAKDSEFRAIAIYPTLALANDQIRRISTYSMSIGIPVVRIDATLRDELMKKYGKTYLRKELSESKLVITNPAFLLHEVKKLLLSPTSCILDLRRLDAIILDEFDFYGPRSIALLLGVLKILTEYSDRDIQVIVLTATLANPEDMCSYLETITNRKCGIVDGEPFRVENRTYIVLGKNIEDIWNIVKKHKQDIISRSDIDKDVVEALDNLDIFKKNSFRVIQYLEALGYQMPSMSIDIKEILSRYSKDNGVTLVFTRSIARADEIGRMLKEIIGDNVAVHHHLIPKKDREIIEEKTRKGEIKIIISPKTLTQGIDIGTVIRVVHIGLPESVREFLQREGRKGRRREITFSESIIIPSTRWDWELLSKGIDIFGKWLSLPLEKTIINPKNMYIYLFTGLAKILSPWYRENFSEEEYNALKNVKVVKRDGSIDIDRAKWIWEKLNFYEFGPPYGVKRYIENDEKLIPLEPIGHCDLVERFQKGCIDLSNDSIVKLVESGKNKRIARAVIETKLSKFNLYRDDAFAEAVEDYRYIKMLWNEEPNILRDIARGKLNSYVLAIVYTPRQGFGEYIKIPNRVLWHLISSRPRIIKVGEKHIVTYNRRIIYVPVETAGMYRDYTYGFYIETDEKDDVILLRLGLAYLMVFLRTVYGIPFETIMYSVGRIGLKKFFEIHEPESAGIIEILDWDKIRRDLERYIPRDLDLVLLLQLDDIAYSDLLSLGIDLDHIKEIAIRIIDYILLRKKISAIFRDKKISIPKPSRALKLLSIDFITNIFGEEEPIKKALVGLCLFDGENIEKAIDLYIMYPFTPPPKSLRDFEIVVEDMAIYSGMKIITYDKELAVKEIEKIGLKRLARAIKDYGFSIRESIARLGIEPISLSTIAQELLLEGIELDIKSIDIADLHKIYINYIEKNDIKEVPIELRDIIEKYLSARARLLYILYLVSKSLIKQSDIKQSI